MKGEGVFLNNNMKKGVGIFFDIGIPPCLSQIFNKGGFLTLYALILNVSLNHRITDRRWSNFTTSVQRVRYLASSNRWTDSGTGRMDSLNHKADSPTSKNHSPNGLEYWLKQFAYSTNRLCQIRWFSQPRWSVVSLIQLGGERVQGQGGTICWSFTIIARVGNL